MWYSNLKKYKTQGDYMKPRNLISVFQGDAAIESIGLDINKQFDT